jgi:hypothetical protein
VKEAEIVIGQLVEPRKEAPIVLELVHQALHQVALPIDVRIVRRGMRAPASRGDHRLGTPFLDGLAEAVGVIVPVGQHLLDLVEGRGVEQVVGLGQVMGLAGRQREVLRLAQGLRAQMDLGAEPASAAAQRLLRLAPLFVGAPAAQGWARTTVESRMRCSRSGSWATWRSRRSQTPFSHHRTKRRYTVFHRAIDLREETPGGATAGHPQDGLQETVARLLVAHIDVRAGA